MKFYIEHIDLFALHHFMLFMLFYVIHPAMQMCPFRNDLICLFISLLIILY